MGKGQEVQKEYFFPCGESVYTKTDAGHAIGVLVSQKKTGDDEASRYWKFKECRNCERGCTKTTLQRYMNMETNEQSVNEDSVCVAYSMEYIKNGKKPTVRYMDNGGYHGDYLIEIVLQNEDFQRIMYLKGKSENCSLLTLIDETFLEDELEPFYDKEDGIYALWMTSTETGKPLLVEYETLDDVMKQIISVRFLETGDK